jgi:hypothetical protein
MRLWRPLSDKCALEFSPILPLRPFCQRHVCRCETFKIRHYLDIPNDDAVFKIFVSMIGVVIGVLISMRLSIL